MGVILDPIDIKGFLFFFVGLTLQLDSVIYATNMQGSSQLVGDFGGVELVESVGTEGYCVAGKKNPARWPGHFNLSRKDSLSFLSESLLFRVALKL